MLATDLEIADLARDLISRHGLHAARAAVQQLNEMIDRNDVHERDVWACVVHLIHERQGPSPLWTDRPLYAVHRGPLLPLAAQAAAPARELREMAAA